jgi:hypothetical protein
VTSIFIFKIPVLSKTSHPCSTNDVRLHVLVVLMVVVNECREERVSRLNHFQPIKADRASRFVVHFYLFILRVMFLNPAQVSARLIGSSVLYYSVIKPGLELDSNDSLSMATTIQAWLQISFVVGEFVCRIDCMKTVNTNV